MFLTEDDLGPFDLAEPFSKRWKKGYLQQSKDGRRYVVLYNSSKDRTITSYARYLMGVKTGAILEKGVVVDHIDNDYTNDSLDNLHIVTHKCNNIKSVLYHKGEIKSDIPRKCNVCGIVFYSSRYSTTCKNESCLKKISSVKYRIEPLSINESEYIRELFTNGYTYDQIREITGFSSATITKYTRL